MVGKEGGGEGHGGALSRVRQIIRLTFRKMIPVECGDGMEHWRLEVVAVRNHPGDKMSVASLGDQAVERVRCGCWWWGGVVGGA